MHHFARRSAVLTMTLAAGTLLFTGCGKDDDKDASTKASDAMNSASAAMSSAGSAMASAGSAMSSAAEAATETKIATQNGDITVSGKILAKYTEMGGPAGTLSQPTGSAVSGPEGGSCQEFVGGAICYSDKTGPHVVWGEIRKAWEADGGVNGKLGYPTEDEKDIPGGKQSDFTGGSITWVNNQTSVTLK
ncbi:esterase [Nocardia sp. CDC159]|uniref:Esterase n=1 Tax=Nocardia pulmonis TaxID=2951408 RepID=A0A9X2E8Z3_9NOCA|nr:MULTISPECIES: esterase [Nocardia]MCM6775969.1 esterase [Nocardia pulmonis]MCM6788055.1 esterase [Nocardia sp. CDC159]